MKRKSLLLAIISILVIVSGCSMNKRETNVENVDKSSAYADEYLNAKYRDVDEYLGTPNSATYYVDIDELQGRDLSTLTTQDLKDHVLVESIYSTPNTDLYLLFEQGLVTNVSNERDYKKLLSYNNLDKIDYQIEFYKNKGLVCEEKFKIEEAREKFVNNDITNFNEYVKTDKANFVVSSTNSNDKLYLYTRVPCGYESDSQHKHPNYGSNTDAKLSIVNPSSNNVSYTNQTDNYNLSDYSNSVVMVYTTGTKINSMNIVTKDDIYKLVDELLK